MKFEPPTVVLGWGALILVLAFVMLFFDGSVLVVSVFGIASSLVATFVLVLTEALRRRRSPDELLAPPNGGVAIVAAAFVAMIGLGIVFGAWLAVAVKQKTIYL